MRAAWLEGRSVLRSGLLRFARLSLAAELDRRLLEYVFQNRLPESIRRFPPDGLAQFRETLLPVAEAK